MYYTKQEMKAWTKKEREAFFEKEKKEKEGKKEDDDKSFKTKDNKDEKSEKEYESNGTWYTGEKEEGTWYKLGKRAVSIPSEWKADNGNNYVLNFKNEGISNFILRGYKQDNANDFSYPDGVNLIGVKGGVVELTGVGKLELPEGALDKDTFISMKQELQAYQYIIYSGEHPTVYDYISPVIKIEPFGLKLNKTAKIYAETDIKRLGDNHPYVLKDSGSFSIDKKKWITSYDIFPDGIKKLDWKTNFPATINQLGFFAKFIFNFMKYNSGYGYYSDDSYEYLKKDINNIFNFEIKSDSIDVNKVFKEHFRLEPPPKNIDLSNEAITRLAKAYTYFNSITAYNPSDYGKDKRISIFLVPEANSAYTNTDKDNNIFFVLNTKNFALEHELWHAFQRYNKNFDNSRYTWIKESSAVYMGAYAYKKYGESLNQETNDKSTYIATLQKGIDRQNETSQLVDVSDKRLDLPISFGKVICDKLSGCSADPNFMKNYFRSDFFTFLGHPETKNLLGISSNEYIMKTLYDERNNIMKYYQDYAVHSFLADRKLSDDYYPQDKAIVPDFLKIKNISESLLSKSFVLYNNSTRYFNIYTEENIDPEKLITLSVKVNTSDNEYCKKNVKISAIFFDESDPIFNRKAIKIPQYLDPNNPEKISQIRIDLKEVDKDGIANLKGNTKYPFIGFDKYFKNLILVVSNSDEKIYETENEDYETCSYTVEACLECFDDEETT
ncbi:MAG: hypothetical protein U0457_00675 [Candidatus Sericytochromatia bacterium]